MNRITLRELDKADLEYRVKLLNTPSIRQFLNVSEVFNISSTNAWFEANKGNKARFDCSFLYGSELVGMGGLTHISEIDRNAEFYIYIDDSFQGKGLGTESTMKLLEYGFNKLNLERVYLYTFDENSSANHLYEKVGFKLEGILRHHTYKDSKLHNRRIYGILKNEYLSFL